MGDGPARHGEEGWQGEGREGGVGLEGYHGGRAGRGMGMEWKWNGAGMESGMEVEWEWNGGGMGVEGERREEEEVEWGWGESGGRKRRNDAWGGMGMEWEWNGSGKGVEWMRRWTDQETGGGEGSKQLTKMSSSNAKPWVNEGRSRKGKGRKWNTNLIIKDADDNLPSHR